MNGIDIAGEFLDTAQDTAVELVLKNPIFADGNVIPGSYSLPFKVPAGNRSEKNSRILKHPDVIESTETQPVIDNVKYWYDGILLKKGKLELGEASEKDSASVSFLFGMAMLAEDFKTAKIRDICNESVVMASGSYTKRIDIICRTNIFPGDTFKITVNGREYSATTNLLLANAINADTTEPRAKATYQASSHPSFPIDSGAYFQLEPYTDADKIATPLTVENDATDIFHKVAIDTLDLENAYNLPVENWLNTNFYLSTPLDSRMVFPMIRNRELYENKAMKSRGGFAGYDLHLVNAVYSGDGYKLNRVSDFDEVGNPRFRPFNRTSISPMIRLQWVLEKISDHFGIDYEGDFLTDPDLARAFFYHSNTLDERIAFLGSYDWIATKRSFNTNDFLPDWTAVDLLKNIGIRFNLAIYYNELSGRIRLQKRDPIIMATNYEEISPLASPAKPPRYNDYTAIRLEAAQDKDDKLSVNDFYETGEAGKLIRTMISGMPAQSSFTLLEGTGLINNNPAGSSMVDIPVSERRDSTDIPGVLAFYEWKESTGSVEYNYPSANIHLEDGDFRFDGPSGLAEARWKNWLRFLLKRKLVSINCTFDLPHINRIDWEQKRRFDRLNYLYESVKVKLTNRRIESAEVEIWTA